MTALKIIIATFNVVVMLLLLINVFDKRTAKDNALISISMIALLGINTYFVFC